jgi:hypothetical protein
MASNSKGNTLHVYHFITTGDKEKHPGYIVKKIKIQTFNGMTKQKKIQIQKLQHI